MRKNIFIFVMAGLVAAGAIAATGFIGDTLRPSRQVQEVTGVSKDRRQEPGRAVKTSRPLDLSRLAAARRAPLLKGESADEHGIITSPADGELKYYTRSGSCYYYDSGWKFHSGTQSGHVAIVETADGTVYIKDIISHFTRNSWVKGTREGNTITVPTGQPLTYDTEYGITESLHRGTYGDGWSMSDAESITFAVDGDKITLQNTDADNYIGAFWDGGYNSFSGFGDYATVWTLDTGYKPASRELVTPPAGLSAEPWWGTGAQYEGEAFETYVTVGFDGGDIYVKGLFSEFPDSWIKGAVTETGATFPALQFLGYRSDGTPVWAAGFSGQDAEDMVFTFDPDDNSYNSTAYLLTTGKDDEISYYECFTTFSFMPSKPQPVVVEEMPYYNDFESNYKRRQFSVIDANDDGSTWESGLYTRTGTNMFYYSYNSANNADDWLISPKVKLEAGKHYRFSLNAWAERSSYPERVEVKLGKSPQASAMTQTVIEPTVVSNTMFVSLSEAQLLENEHLTVEETGYYYIGIHAVSDKDKYYLYVDNFTLETGTSPTSPAAVTGLSGSCEPDADAVTLQFTAPATTVGGDALTGSLTVDLFRDGNRVARAADVPPGSEQTVIDDNNLTTGVHSYFAVAQNAAGASPHSDTVTVYVARSADIPALHDFTGDYSNFLVIDANGDDRTWYFNSSEGASYSFGFQDADDWIIVPPVRLQAGKSYNVSINAKNMGAADPETVEIRMGKAPTVEAMTLAAMDTTVIVTAGDYEDFGSDFTVPADGVYFMGLHIMSERTRYRLMVRRMSVTMSTGANAPAAPAVSAVSDPEGKTAAIITVVAPDTTAQGAPITGNISKLEVMRDDHVIHTQADVAPGSTFTVTDTLATKDFHTYTAVAYDADGLPGLKSDKATIYVGQDLPAYINGITYADNGDSYTFMWEKVGAEGRNGGVVNPALVDYVIHAVDFTTVSGVEVDVEGEELGRVRDDDHFTLTGLDTDSGNQGYVSYYFRTENIAGTTRNYRAYVVTGAPYTLPLEEHFNDKTLHYLWDFSDATELQVSTDASDGDGCALKLMPSGVYGYAVLETGKIDMSAAGAPVISFDLKTGQTHATEFNVYYFLPDGERHQLAKLPIPTAYQNHRVSLNLADIKAARFARVGIGVDYVGAALGEYVLIDNIAIYDAADVNGDGSVNAADVTAVYNVILGLDDSNAARADVNCDGSVNAADVTALYNIILGL